jgi:hypothetical protein
MDRRNAYRDKPCHEQAAWLRRIESDPHFEASQLVSMITTGQAARAMPGRALFPLALQELAKRARSRVSAKLAHALFGHKRGREIDNAKTYKGL